MKMNLSLSEIRMSVFNLFHQRCSWLMILLVAGLLSFKAFSPVHAMTITGYTPEPEAIQVATNADITVQFSDNINSETVTPSMFTIKAGSGIEFTYEVSGSSIVLTPEEEFTPGQKVTVTVKPAGIESSDQDPMTDTSTHQWDFYIIHGIASVTPASNANKVQAGTTITLKFSEELIPNTLGASSFTIEGSISGSHTYTQGVSSDSVTLTPDEEFVTGEAVTVIAKTKDVRVVERPDKETEIPHDTKDEILQWQFIIAVYGNIHYIDSGQKLGDAYTRGVALNDLDGDGDMDAFAANGAGVDDLPEKRTNRVWINDGSGKFTDSGQTIGDSYSYCVVLGDLDGDDDVDAFVANGSGGTDVKKAPNIVWLNNGNGVFSDSGQRLGDSDSRSVALGDIDRDGDLDAFVANNSNPLEELDGANKVWINDGNGNFTDSSQALGGADSYGVALGDIDGDGDMDAFVANYSQGNKVWKNNGTGTFTDSGQSLGGFSSYSVTLGDVDGDKDLDAFVANYGWANKVWLNSGKGIFEETENTPANDMSRSFSAVLKDLDGDGDADVFIANGATEANRVWLNDKGKFADSGKGMGAASSLSVALGDVDDDDDMDAFVGNYASNQVWLNNGPPKIDGGSSVTVNMDENETPRAFELTLSATDPEGWEIQWGFDPDVTKTNIITDGGKASILSLTGNSKEIYYKPNRNFSGEDSFVVWVSDTIDAASAEVKVKIEPNVPVITEGDLVTVEMDEDSSPTAFELTLNATDISDPEGELLTWSVSSLPGHGDADITGNGLSAVVSYTPDADYDRTDRFVVRVRDNASGSDSITVDIRINPQNDVPVVTEDIEIAQILFAAETELDLTPKYLSELKLTTEEKLKEHVIDPDDDDDSFPLGFTATVYTGDNYTCSGDTITPEDGSETYCSDTKIRPSEGFTGVLTVPITVNDGEADSNKFYLSARVYYPGDIDASGSVALKDAIIGLQILTGAALGEDITLDLDADVNGDEKIGMEDVNYILGELVSEE